MKQDYNRLTTCTLLALVLGPIVAVWPAAGLGQDPTEQQDPWAPYKVIVERNMFSRQRGARAERLVQDRVQVRTPPPAPNPESYYVLKGIVQENSAFIAFLEDSRGGEILRVRKGDSVARGVIKALSLDSIEYQLEDSTVTVKMGRDLQGGQGAVTRAQLYEWSQTSTTTSQEAATEPSSPSGDDADILRQLMERRQQQLEQ